MLRNYFRTTFRVIARHPGYASINISGLSVGVAVSLLLFLFLTNEVGYDRHHENADRIYRAWVLEDYGENQQFFNTTTPLPLASMLAAALPEVEYAVRYDRLTDTVRRGDTSFDESIFMVDPDFFSVFDLPVVAGNLTSPLDGPTSIVLTQSAATRYFGVEDPIGKELSIDFSGDPHVFEVSAVIENVRRSSNLQFELLISYSVADWFYSPRRHTAWMSVSPETYVMLKADADIAAVEAKLPNIVTSALGDRVEPGQYTVGLQPLLDIHLNPDFPIGYATVSSPIYVQILLSVALLVLLIACINFVTLSLSRASTRSREIGVRKAIGAQRSQLIRQYFGESSVFTGVAVAIGLGLAYLLLPAFNAISSQELSLTLDAATLMMLGGLFLSISLITGIYPAIVMASFSPTEAFRGSSSSGSKRGLLRKSLVTVQFSLSILLLVSMLVMGSQLRFIDNIDLGFNEDRVLYIPTELSSTEGAKLAERIRFETGNRADIESVATAVAVFDPNGWIFIGYQATDGTYRRFFTNLVDYEFVSTMNLRVQEGRSFDRDLPSDAVSALIVNEAFVDAYGWESPLEAQIPGRFAEHEIIGVVDNFHYTSLHNEIQPAVLSLSRNLIMSGANDVGFSGNPNSKIIFRVAGDDLPGTLAYLESMMARVAPELPFSYQFVDQDIAQLYEQEDRLSTIIMLGALLAVLIAGQGLFGLAAISVARLTKEIGVRKVLGASASNIVALLGREFSTLVVIALVVAGPIGYFGLTTWLETFAYHTSVGVTPFVVAGLSAFALMWLAVSAQALKAASANPVIALRDQ